MFWMDAKALYPSVPRKEAHEAAEKALEKRSNKDIPTDEVLRIMDMVLENNNFSFNWKHYVQTEGTAIDSHLRMNYASVYLGSWGKTLFQNSKTKKPLTYFRFVDDVWGLWSDGLDSLKDFHRVGNSIHPRLQVDLRYSTEKL